MLFLIIPNSFRCAECREEDGFIAGLIYAIRVDLRFGQMKVIFFDPGTPFASDGLETDTFASIRIPSNVQDTKRSRFPFSQDIFIQLMVQPLL